MHRQPTFLLPLFLVFVLMFGVAYAPQTSAGPVIDRILKKGVLTVGTAGNMPPLNMTTKDGQVVGMEPDLAKMMAGAMEVELRLKTMAFADLLGALQAGKVDMVISGMTMTPQRNLKVAFAGPYMISGKCFLSKADEIAAARDPSQIKRTDLTLAALEGSTSQFFVEQFIPKAKLVTTVDYDEGVDLVLNGKVDAMVADFPLCAVSLIRYPGAGLSSLFTRLTYEPLGIALPANDPLLVNWVENLMDTLDATGRLEKIEKRWLEDGWWLSLLPK
ncbi:MAG: transporter substrate-binding domain-containing protein [Acidiferrobacterales bacterium]